MQTKNISVKPNLIKILDMEMIYIENTISFMTDFETFWNILERVSPAQ